MRFADIVIDLASVLSATRSVASKHVALQSRQLDRYSKTSSILKGGLQPRPRQQRQGGDSPPVTHRHDGDTATATEPAPGQPAEPPDTAATTSSPKQADIGRPIGDGTAPKVAEPPETPREATARVIIPHDEPGSALDELRGRLRELGGDAKAAEQVQSPVLRDILLRDTPMPRHAGPARMAAEREEEEVMGEKVPEGVDINIFRTRRGSRILQSLKSRERRIEKSVINHDITPEAQEPESITNMSQADTPTHVEKTAVDSIGSAASVEEAPRVVGQDDPAGAAEAVTAEAVLQRVQDRADYMPAWQRDRVLAADLGMEWRSLFSEFEETPIAAASIGQVHRATLKSSGRRVAVKVQFPGVAESINSDLDNLAVLLNAASLLPKGLYLDKTIANARTELAWECDYEREAECARRYRDMLLAAEAEDSQRRIFAVPEVFAEASGKHVLTMEFMNGVGVTRAVSSLSQEQRDWIGTQILRLCLREITEFRFMQTDPNWTNFLYNAPANRLELLDFGASREYPVRFISLYVRLLLAASRSDGQQVKELSERLGYLTGHESKAMLEAHTRSVLTLAEPFLASAPEVYDFSDQTITERVKGLIPTMVRERLAPPPEETYSLHRKLSGAFLLCARLGSRVRCREMFERSVERSGVLEDLEEETATTEGATSSQ
ncbi:atypical/ABC1/ABC1-A protein kinase [Magnaporthiopsis poae ATCC 64411]|uniref:Atypical/ABC1/ABC1-A protein kinase n=1 Tax=Magnaporthiopsis poae (strain ATCC 64411 / 73-15) TaxID=644358 RepID=A0A0C4DVG4_MAGP6|nr:atypical/ABC1/ABC1-A protein kinase [Magnaporthiopsis poae ATCC 64411]